MDIWQQTLDQLRPEMAPKAFGTWLRPTSLLKDAGTRILVRVPNRLFSDWIGRNYGDRIAAVVAGLGRPGLGVEYVPEGEQPPIEKSEAGAVVSREPDGLNSRYTFESFVVSTCNEFAHAAAMRVAEVPSQTYNPLFVYGGVGLGKTHLMHAVGNRIRENLPHLRQRYISTETFVNEL